MFVGDVGCVERMLQEGLEFVCLHPLLTHDSECICSHFWNECCLIEKLGVVCEIELGVNVGTWCYESRLNKCS